MLFCPERQLQSHPPDPPFAHRAVGFPDIRVPLLTNRLGKFFNPAAIALNLQLMDSLPIPNLRQLAAFAPEVILICPVSHWCLLMGHKVAQHFPCPSLVYFMDDWLATDQTRWWTGNVQTVGYEVLAQAQGWLMISDRLQSNLSKRYGLNPERSLIVHNPVDLADKSPPAPHSPENPVFRVVYAGSIWGMHYDALAAVAEAILALRQDGVAIELVIHTEPGFWDMYKFHWERCQVVNGGLVPYTQLDGYLQQADVLLVACSFSADYASVIRSSVFTKLTDYMVTGRPILCCGPSYAACNSFIKKWNCGLVCETNQVPEIQNFLRQQLVNQSLHRSIAQTAFEVVRNHFEKQIVSQKLHQFIAESKYDVA